jgi:hypothetical protein
MIKVGGSKSVVLSGSVVLQSVPAGGSGGGYMNEVHTPPEPPTDGRPPLRTRTTLGSPLSADERTDR